ncbi:MAG: nucleoside kinase [Lachnospiraceae bacterium]|nr:nucleoside kinase [Lachnospiraceae bacterium]
MAEITIGHEEYEIPEGMTYEELAKKHQDAYEDPIALAVVDGKICELFKTIEGNSNVSFMTIKDDAGHKAYVRTATIILMKALRNLLGDNTGVVAKVEYTIGTGYYVNIKGKDDVDQAFIDRLSEEMRSIVRAKKPIKKSSLPIAKAVHLFAEQGMTDKVKLFKYRKSSSVNVYELDGFYDYYYGYMLPDTGYMQWFELLPYEDGLIMNLPAKSDPCTIVPFVNRKMLFSTLRQADAWGERMGISSVGDLNNAICSGEIADLLLVQEALQERRIGEIASEIAGRGHVKFVMIAGPSSSGKTTFSHRLSVQLRTYGLKPHPIALDNYFVNRVDTPRDEKGDYNYEILEAIDVKLFNENMVDLLNGKEVSLPTYNFMTGEREFRGDIMKLADDDILVIEGIHGLNDKMSYSLPDESKYKIYISALTSLNIDDHNRIPTTDGRLLRRMVRDARTRGASAKRTIHMWPNVRKGEEENIFPFQEHADTFFNSASIFELAALKQFAEPLLYEIGEDEPEYHEAKRLLKFLEYFLGISIDTIPNNSIVREFVGGSIFPV